MMKQTLKNKDIMIVLILYLVCAVAFFYLYYMQASGLYVGDLAVHINSAIAGRGYSLLSFIYWSIYCLTGKVGIICLFLSFFSVLSAGVTAAVIKYMLRKKHIDLQWGVALLIGLLLLFVCKIFIPGVSPTFYVGQSFITQPWHNQTYIFMRCFALLTVVIYFEIERRYLQLFEIKDAIFFTIALSLTNAMKPNFVLFFSLVMLLYLIKDFIRTRGKGLKKIFLFGSCVLVSLVILIWQSTRLFPTDSNEGGITVTFSQLVLFFSSWKNIVGLIISLLFPILIYAWMVWRKQERGILNKIWIMLGVAALESFCLVETGARATHGNFIWGRYCAGWLLFVFSVVQYISLVDSIKYTNDKKERILCCVTGGILGINILCGIIYFILLLLGTDYGI